MPPEILGKKSYDPKKADIWSLGVLLYKLVFDRYPFKGRDERDLLDKITRGKLIYSEYCSEDLKDILENMMAKNPKERAAISQLSVHKWLA